MTLALRRVPPSSALAEGTMLPPWPPAPFPPLPPRPPELPEPPHAPHVATHAPRTTHEPTISFTASKMRISPPEPDPARAPCPTRAADAILRSRRAREV